MKTERYPITNPGNIVESFTTRSLVTIKIWDVSTGKELTVEKGQITTNECEEIGNSGTYKWPMSNIVNPSLQPKEYIYEMTTGNSFEDGRVQLYDDGSPRGKMKPSKHVPSRKNILSTKRKIS